MPRWTTVHVDLPLPDELRIDCAALNGALGGTAMPRTFFAQLTELSKAVHFDALVVAAMRGIWAAFPALTFASGRATALGRCCSGVWVTCGSCTCSLGARHRCASIGALLLIMC